jgi:glucoamylase
MAFLVPIVLVGYVLLYAFAFSIPPLPNFLGIVDAQHAQTPLQDTLSAWIEIEESVALDKLLANVAPGGKNVWKDAIGGSVIASPSRERPDYFYQCMHISCHKREDSLLTG